MSGFFRRTRQSGFLQRTNDEVGREKPGPFGLADATERVHVPPKRTKPDATERVPPTDVTKHVPPQLGGPRSVVAADELAKASSGEGDKKAKQAVKLYIPKTDDQTRFLIFLSWKPLNTQSHTKAFYSAAGPLLLR